ncbi:hypothetical protein HYQ44_013665 [Verticillium longisporum]|nr:hypothetical protein HYQ44_013665 [Verticillium longisporum]
MVGLTGEKKRAIRDSEERGRKSGELREKRNDYKYGVKNNNQKTYYYRYQMGDNQIQCYAAMTVGFRLKVVHMLNRIDSIRDYNEVLELGAKLELISEDIGYLFPRNNSLSDSEQSKMWRLRGPTSRRPW